LGLESWRSVPERKCVHGALGGRQAVAQRRRTLPRTLCVSVQPVGVGIAAVFERLEKAVVHSGRPLVDRAMCAFAHARGTIR
jgi:hypothetical protein